MTARTITTVSELDALPDEHVLLKASGRYRYIRGAFEQCWVRPVPSSITGTDERMWEVLVYGAEIPSSLVHSEDLDLPVTVLHDPSATREDVAERVALKVENVHHMHGPVCLCGFDSHGRSRSATEHITRTLLAGLREACVITERDER